MEKLPVLFLVVYHFIFWNRFYSNPYLLSTSEIASTYFPFWLWTGRKWRGDDCVYYRHPRCIPFLSMYYAPSVLVSKVTKYLSLDVAFVVYCYFIIGHYLLASLIAYKVMGLFGAITLTYAGYSIKPQTPSFVYTMTWIPGMLVGGWFGAFSCFMAVTGGYWPILVYVIPVVAILNPWCLLGLVPALVQIIPFLWYWPKSVRSGEKVDGNFGRLPWWKLKDLVWPSNSVRVTNGVHYPEVECYLGIAPFLIWHWSWLWIPLSLSVLFLTGILPPIQRIPARVAYCMILLISLLSSIPRDHELGIFLIVQAVLLLQNSSIYPSFPFSQWWKRPSSLYHKSAVNGKWPHITGYLKGERISDYRGAFALRHGR